MNFKAQPTKACWMGYYEINSCLCLDFPVSLLGEDVLPGFILDLPIE